jgi:hypothetical protein
VLPKVFTNRIKSSLQLEIDLKPVKRPLNTTRSVNAPKLRASFSGRTSLKPIEITPKKDLSNTKTSFVKKVEKVNWAVKC